MIQRTASAPRLIGCIGMDRMESGDVELGYWVAQPYWGLGYATEAGRHMIDLARTLRIRRLVASHFTANPAPGAVLRKLGFRPTRRHPDRASLGRRQPAPPHQSSRETATPATAAARGDTPLANHR